MIEYLKILNKEEKSKFEKFLNSSFFNTNVNIVKLFYYLKSNSEISNEKNLPRKEIYKILYPGKKYEDTKYRKVVSDFSKTFEKFLMYMEIENDDLSSKTLLLKALRKKNLSKRFESNMRELKKIYETSFSKDSEFYRSKIEYEQEYYYYNFNKYKQEFAFCLQEKSDNLDYYFIFSKLHTFMEMFTNEINTARPDKFNKSFYIEIISAVEKNKELISKKHPNIFIAYNVLQMFITSDKLYLEQLTSYLESNESKFSKEKLSHYYNYFVAYYTYKINKGNIEYRKGLFEIFKIMSEKKLFLIDNLITDAEYNSVINTSLSLGEQKWVENFIENYKKFLDPEFKNDAYSLAKAKLFFYKKDYENIFAYLNEIKYKDPVYYINSKFLLARVYFDTEKSESMQYVLENLKQYIRDKKRLPEDQKSAVKIFVQYAASLIRIKELLNKKNKKPELIILKKEIENNKKLVPNKNWFLEKIEENNKS